MKKPLDLYSPIAPSTEYAPKTEGGKPPAENRNPPRGSSTASAWDDRLIELLWERMTALYGHRWTSQHGAADDGTWAKGLADIDPNSVGQAIKRLLNRGDAWPPSLPEFRMMCRYSDGSQFGMDHVPEVYRENRPGRLLTGPRDDERGKREIARIKAILATKNRAPPEDEALPASVGVTTTATHEHHIGGPNDKQA